MRRVGLGLRSLRPALVISLICAPAFVSAQAPVAGQNVNMVSGTQWPGGDPFLQRQNEPSLAVSSRNALHLLAGANDYRTVDLPVSDTIPGSLAGDAWLGVFKSFDGGLTWQSVLHPGYPQDQSAVGLASPLKVYSAAADPTVRAGTSGLFYYSGIAFNRGTNIGGVFVSTFLDANAKENGDATQGKDTIKFLTTTVIDTGTSGQFIDKPWVAVDIPRSGAGTCTFSPFGSPQAFPAGNVYIVWSRFTGSQSTKIMFSRSLDCGKTWSNPIKLSESNSINQGTNLAIDPVSGTVYAAWRRFATSSQGDAIVIAKSTDFGQTFTSKNTAQVAAITPFDQATTGTEFRTNALPSVAASVDAAGVSRVHVAWAQRNAANQDAQIVVASSADGLSWGAPVAVDTAPLLDDFGNAFSRGHQFMPQLTFAAGRLMLVYYDQRLDHTLSFSIPNNPFVADGQGRFYLVRRDKKAELLTNPAQVYTLQIDDGTLTARRHTVDLRVAEAIPGGSLSFASSLVSQYRFGLRALDDFGAPIGLPSGLDQLQTNPPNLPLFSQGTLPFFGDYIDIAGQAFLPNGDGTWSFNTSRSSTPVFYASWTDNRDVKPPLDGNWAHYTPAGGGVQSVLDPTQTTPLCVNGQEGMRNQNIYSSRITEGLLVGSPQDAKPLSSSLQRAFVVTLQNLTAQDRAFTMTLSPKAGVSASFLQGSTLTSLTVTVPARSGAARPIFATSSNPAGSIVVNVVEAPEPGSLGLSGFIVLNPEGSVSPLAQPDGSSADIGSLEIYTPTFEVWNPANPNPFLSISNPNQVLSISNLSISNVDPAILSISNMSISNLSISNLSISNPDPAILSISNLNISNSAAANLSISNLSISNLSISNTPITDATYAVTNSGNTSHSYRVALYGNNSTNAPLQVIVTKNSTTPVSVACTLQNAPQSIAVTSAGNAAVAATLADATNPNIGDGSAANTTMALAPGETGFITLRAPITAQQMADLVRGLSPVITAHGTNTNGGTPDFALLLFIQVPNGGVLPAAVVGTPYSTTLTAQGGKGQLTWTLASGALPSGLTLSPGGTISGTPTGSGTFDFTITVTDQSSPIPESATQTVHITVAGRVTTTSVSFGANPIVVGQTTSVAATVSDTQAGGAPSFPTGTVTITGDPALSAGSCVLAPTATAGVSSCTVSITPPSPGPRTIQASYPGSAVHQASSGGNQLNVNKAPTATAFASSANPSVFGQTVTFTATISVTPPGAGMPTGSVTFFDGPTSLGAVPFVAGKAILTTASLSVGSHSVTASYTGDGSFSASVSTAFVQTVNKAGTATSLTSVPNPSAFSQVVTFTATVTVMAPGAGTPGSSVTFLDGGAAIGTAAVVAGSATFSTGGLAAGSHSITASYSGDANFSPSVSAVLTQVVNAPPLTFVGFGSPLTTAGTLSSPSFSGNQNLGSAVPLKWQLFNSAGQNVTDLSSTTSLQAILNTTCSGAPTGPATLLYAPTVGATGGSTFRSSSSGFIFNWDTSVVAPTGPACYTIVLQLSDGSAPKATTVRLK